MLYNRVRGERMNNDEKLKNIIRDNLIKCRTDRDLSQTEVGLIVGKSKTAVASWEQGLSMPDVATLYKLAQYYGKTIGYMYGEEEE